MKLKKSTAAVLIGLWFSGCAMVLPKDAKFIKETAILGMIWLSIYWFFASTED